MPTYRITGATGRTIAADRITESDDTYYFWRGTASPNAAPVLVIPKAHVRAIEVVEPADQETT